jgi:hypothetical protein
LAIILERLKSKSQYTLKFDEKNMLQHPSPGIIQAKKESVQKYNSTNTKIIIIE